MWQGDDGRLPHVHPRQPGEEAGQARGQGKGQVVHQLYNIMILKIQNDFLFYLTTGISKTRLFFANIRAKFHAEFKSAKTFEKFRS